MIEIKTYSKPKKTGGSGGSSSSTKYISGVISEAEHAGRADKAKRAEVADQANYAGTAASAQNAAYASEAGNLHADAEILQKYLSLEDTVDPQVVKGMVIFAKGLISNLLAQLKGGASFGSDGSYSFDKDGNLVIESAHSRDFDEMLQNGFALKRNPTSGKYTLSISDLIVWGRMVINTLETRKKYAIGGNVYLSGASSKIQHVEKVYSEDGETVVGYKCYILKDDGTMATQNGWVVGDQALCQTFDIEEGVYQNVSNQYYWRLVTQVSEENVAITEKYIDKDGNEQIRELYEGQKFAWVVLSKDDCDTNSGIPASGDTIVMDGHRLTENEDTDYTERTNVLMLEATGSGSPRIIALTGIVDYKHETDNEVFILSPQKVIFTTEHFEIRTASGAPITFVHFMGPWVEGTEYHYYDQVSHANALWTCIVEKGKSTTDEPTDGNVYWRKEMSGGKGEKGDDGKTPQPTGSAETYYAITSSPSTEPNDSSWTATPIDTSKHQGKFLWTDNRTEWKIGDKTEWISNKTCSYIGKDGANGTSVSIKGSLSDIGDLPVSGNVNGDSYLIDGYLWIYTGTSVDDDNHHNGFENVGKIKGEDGISATQYYYHVAWMNTSDNSDNSFTTTNPSGSSYAYIGTLIDTTEEDSDDYTKYDWAYVKGDRGYDGKNAIRLDLTNESSTVTCDKDGNIIGTIQGTVAILYDGAKEADINKVSYYISSYKGLSSMPTISEGGVVSDLSVSGGKTSLEASINIKAVYENHDYYATYTITKVLAGSDGAPATTYWIEPSATAIKVDSDGNANPSTITCKQYKQVGAESPVAGDKKIYYRHNLIDSTLWNEYTGAIIPAVNVEAYEFVLADRIPSDSPAIIYDRESIPVVKDGQNGNDGLSGNGIVPAYIRSNDNPTPPTSTDKNNLDNGWSLAIPSVAGIPLWQSNGKEVFTRDDSGAIKSEIESWSEPFKVTGENGTGGKDAYRVVVSPSVLIFDTDENGSVAKPSLSGKTATIRVYQGDKDVSDQFSKYDRSPSNKYNCNGSLKDLNKHPFEIQVTEIETQDVTTDGQESTISKTNGFLEFILTNGSASVTAHVDVQVNVAKFTGQMVNTNKRFSKTLQEVSTRVDGKVGSSELTQFKAEITQTAREISLSVSEKSVGRRNLLVGSAFQREDNHYVLSRDARIEMNSGYNGTNCVKVIDDTDGTSHYVGVYWDGSHGGRSIKIEKGKKYTISCYYKTNDTNAKFSLEAIYTNKETNAERLGRPKVLSPNFFNPKYSQWELFTTVIDTTDAESDYIAFNFWEYCNVEAGRINAYICRPMVEEGDTYNGWTLSQDDYDYVGGNMLDNTLSLDKSGSLYDVNGTLTPAGFGESTSIYKSFVYKLKGTVDSFSQLPSSGNVYNDTYYVRNEVTCYVYNGSEFTKVTVNDSYYNVLEWKKGKPGAFTPFGLEANKDYVFSFMAKGTGVLTAYFYSPETDVFIESSLGATNISVDGGTNFQLTNKWERYWVHWRPSDSLHKYVLLRLNRSFQSDGSAPVTDCYIAQPKLEEGARVTEYTERKSDLVDKASLKAAGIEITSDQVILYGNKVQVKNPKANPSEGYDEAAMFQNGKLNAQLINAGDVVAKGIKTQELEAQHLKVTGNSRLGIFEIHKAEIDERDEYTVNGDSIKYSGSYKFPDGKTEASGAGSFLTYKPMFIRQGAPDGYEYMRLGHQFTEWDDGNISGGSKNYFFVGAAARYVCSGDVFSCTRNVLPVTLKYNSDTKPAAYIYSVLAKDSAAFAIYTQAVGTSGERLAIQTNGAIRCVEALNIETIYRSQQISSGIGAARCVNTAEITIRLPINPVVGQKFYVLQEDTGKVNITGDSNHQIILFNKSIVTTCNSNTKGQISIFIWSGNYWFGSFLTGIL